jgi:DNA-binding XRE family transcriptional regulator
MSVTIEKNNAAVEKERVQDLLLAYTKLPKKKKDRVEKLVELLRTADPGSEEQREIAGAIAEILIPHIIGRSQSRPVDLEEGISSAGRQSVDAYHKSVGEAIRNARDEAGMTQEMLAKNSGLPQSHISRLEAGIHAPTNKTIEKIAEALNIDPSKLDLLYDS